MARIGYARVSTNEQVIALQSDALAKAGCVKIFEEHGICGAKANRPQLDAALLYVREGDELVVWKLDRLGRSLPHLIATIAELEKRGVGFVSLTESIDTSTGAGRLIFHLYGALAQFERDLIRERTLLGLDSARAQGRVGGRRPVMTADKARKAEKLFKDGLRVQEVAARLKVSKSALYNAIADKTVHKGH